MSRHRVDKWLRDRIKITRPNTTGDDFGGNVSKKEDIASDVPAHIWPVKSVEEREIAGRKVIATDKMVVLPGVDIEVGDHVTTSPAATAVTFLVMGKLRRRSLHKQDHIALMISRVDFNG